MLTVSDLYIYPIKSLGGISVKQAMVTSRGLQHDRRWMLVDKDNRFLTQRTFPEMALLQVSLAKDGLLVHHKKRDLPPLFIPDKPAANSKTIAVQIWNDLCDAYLTSDAIAAWFSAALNQDCRLVYMPDTTKRMVDAAYASDSEITSFADDYPVLLIGQASLDELNSRLSQPVPMDRFRPNIVFTGGRPFEEDSLKKFRIHTNEFFGVKLCARCVVTTINQRTLAKGKEPLRTLATYRMKNNKIYFGQNLLHKGAGSIRVGDRIEVIELQPGFNSVSQFYTESKE